jgi:hypothetical protein
VVTGPVNNAQQVTVGANETATGVNFGAVAINNSFPIQPQATIFPPGQTGTAAFVGGVYRSLLGRDAEAGGLEFWTSAVNAGLSREQMALSVIQGEEFRGLEVDGYYRTFFNRASDPAGHAFWVKSLMGGLTEQQVVQGFIGAPEYQALYTSNPNFVTSLYRNILGRQPDSGLSFWTTQLAAGATRSSVAAAFANPVLTSPAVVDAFYVAFLHREPDAPGLAYFLNYLEQGGTMDAAAAAILGSQEYYNDSQHA